MCLRVRKETKNKHKSNKTTTSHNYKTKANIYTKLIYDIQSCIKLNSTLPLRLQNYDYYIYATVTTLKLTQLQLLLLLELLLLLHKTTVSAFIT